MYERLDQALQIHKMCLKELYQLKSNVESYLIATTDMSDLIQANWHKVCQGNTMSLMIYDNFLTSTTNIMNSARKFNMQIQLNNIEKMDKSDIFPSMESKQIDASCNKPIKVSTDKSKSMNSNVSYSPAAYAILYPAEEIAESLDSTEDFEYLKLNLRELYKTKSVISAKITYIKDLNNFKFCILDTLSPFSKSIVDISQSIELHQYQSVPPVQQIFGMVLDKCILRAVRCSKLLYDQDTDEEFWPCYLLDFGEVVRLKAEDITYKLTEEQKTTPALALNCQLKSQGKNNSLLENKLQDLLYQNCELLVKAVEEDYLQVELIEKPMTNASISKNIDKKSSSNVLRKDTNPFTNSTKVDQHKLTAEELDMLYDEPLSTSNAMKAVMGYDPQDDKRICRFYDPSTGACFKGSRCKQEHIPRQSDGWTKDVLPAASIIDNRSPLVIYPHGAIINITPTYVGDFERFYAQINDPHQNTAPLIWNEEDVPNWKILQQPPHIFELVLSRYEDGFWYRAKILSHDDDYKIFKVFYVDYGNHQIVHLRNMARIDIGVAQLPFQAVLCRLADVKEVPNMPADNRKTGIKILCEMILNKYIDVKVVSHYEDLIVSFPNKKDYPIPEVLIEMGYMKRFKL